MYFFKYYLQKTSVKSKHVTLSVISAARGTDNTTQLNASLLFICYRLKNKKSLCYRAST